MNQKISLLFFALIVFATPHLSAQNKPANKQYDIAAFLYPAYASDDPRLRPFWPKGNGEWEQC